MKLVSVEQMRAIEAEANSLGVTYDQMMQKAGSGVAQAILSLAPPNAKLNSIGLVGSGNNGGDTLIALLTLRQAGWKTTAYLVRPRHPVDPLLQQLKSAGGEVVDTAMDADFEILNDLIKKADFLIDGILGTGITLPLRQEIARVLNQVKLSSPLPKIVAVDCPSGVDNDTGAAAPETLPAQVTICIEAVKQGLAQLPAFGLAGTVQTISLNLPGELQTAKNINTFWVDPEMVRSVLPKRKMDAHKGTFGTLMVIAGCAFYPGAALLAGKAAYRIGVGLVQMAVPGLIQTMLAGQLPEAIWLPLPNSDGAISSAAVPWIIDSLERASCLLLGPGLGQHKATQEFLQTLLQNSAFTGRPLPMVVDADGLRLIGKFPDWPNLLPKDSILTPHPGEMAALTGCSIAEIQQNRLNLARRYAQSWGHVVILKGALTIVAAPDGRVCIIPVASPALSHAGSGDVLAGLVAGLRAQKLSAFDAAWAGAYIQGKAGLLAGEKIGNPASVLAGDISSYVPNVLTTVL